MKIGNSISLVTLFLCGACLNTRPRLFLDAHRAFVEPPSGGLSYRIRRAYLSTIQERGQNSDVLFESHFPWSLGSIGTFLRKNFVTCVRSSPPPGIRITYLLISNIFALCPERWSGGIQGWGEAYFGLQVYPGHLIATYQMAPYDTFEVRDAPHTAKSCSW